MDIKQLEVFVNVAKFNSFTKAAEELNLSQPTISLHVQNLEKELGVKLFDREGRKASLTPPGKVLYKYAVEIIKLKKKALLAVKEFLGKIEGEFLIGASTVPGEYILPRAIASFVNSYPDTRFSLKVSDSEGIINEVLGENLEIGAVGSKRDSERLTFTPFYEDEIILVRNERLPEIKNYEELSRAPLIMREKGSGTRKIFEEHMQKLGISPKNLNVVAELGSTTAVKEASKSGLGYGIVSNLAVEEELSSGKLIRNSIDSLKIKRQFYMVKKRHKTLSPAISLFMEFIKDKKWESQDDGK